MAMRVIPDNLIFAPASLPVKKVTTVAFINATRAFFENAKYLQKIDPTGIGGMISVSLHTMNIINHSVRLYYSPDEYKKLHKLNARLMMATASRGIINSSKNVLSNPLWSNPLLSSNAQASYLKLIKPLAVATPWLMFAAAGLAWVAFADAAEKLYQAHKKTDPRRLLMHNIKKASELQQRINDLREGGVSENSNEIKVLTQKVNRSRKKAKALSYYLYQKDKDWVNSYEVRMSLNNIHATLSTTVDLCEDPKYASTKNEYLKLADTVIQKQREKILPHTINLVNALLLASGLTILALTSVMTFGALPAVVAAAIGASIVFTPFVVRMGIFLKDLHKEHQNKNQLKETKEKMLEGIDITEIAASIAEYDKGHITTADREKNTKVITSLKELVASAQAGDKASIKELRLLRLAYEGKRGALKDYQEKHGVVEDYHEGDFYISVLLKPAAKRQQLYDEALESRFQKKTVEKAKIDPDLEDVSAANKKTIARGLAFFKPAEKAPEEPESLLPAPLLR